MDILVAVVGGLAAGVVGAFVLVRLRAPGQGRALAQLAGMHDELTRLAERVASDSVRLGGRLEGIDDRMVRTHASNADMARDIFETLGDVRRATTTVAEQAREFSSLQDLLRAPTARGGLGEAMLEELLRQVLPPNSFSTQHRFTSGVIVDAVVRAGGRMACIDAKFPLANFRRMCDATEERDRAEAERAFAADVARHVDDISCRYIVPDEGTFDFAVMYVPAEGVYSEVLRLSHGRRALYETAIEARVIPMSPLTMYAYLTTVLFGLKCLSIEANAEAILGFCGRLQQDMERFSTEYETLGRHVGHAQSKYEEGRVRLERLRGRLERVTDLSHGGASKGGPAGAPAETNGAEPEPTAIP
ncbi:MAG: DNA recombination protein RmuC [Actinomycetota bacterium]|nr:DNA recombination protein RmuC [Actinomycetota bacterium]